MSSFLPYFVLISSVSLVNSLCTNQLTGSFCTNISFDHGFRLNYILNDDLFVKNAKGEISKENFAFLNNLVSLQISESDIDEIRPEALCSIKKLRFLTLKDNKKLPKLDKHIFRDCHHLEYLRIVKGAIRDEAFTDMDNLENVILEKVSFPDGGLKRKTFKGLSNLKKLAILRSKITKIEDQAFASLRNLEELFFEYNDVSYFSPKAFQGLMNLQMLSLRQVPLKKINWMEFNQFKMLSILDLGANDYEQFDLKTFLENVPRCCSKLEEVTMDSNRFTDNDRMTISTEMRKNNVTLTWLPNTS